MEAPNVAREERNNKCCLCNAQICSSYVLGMFACVLVIGGVYLAFHKWDYMWLVVSAIGIVLILIGALLHFCGSNSKENESRMRHTVNEQDLHEHLLPTAPPLNNAYSVSQLSLNMLPPYFSALDNVLMSSQSFPTAPPNSDSISQIVQIKGQSFILLPISENVISNDNESITRWSNQLNAPKDQSEQQVPKAQNPVTVVPITEDCGCQTETLNLHQVTQTSENSIQTSVTSHTEESQVQTTSPSNSFPVIEENSTDESSTNSILSQTEDFQMEIADQATHSHILDTIADCEALPCETCNEEILSSIIQDEESSNSTNETQMETMESGESTESIDTDCQTQVSSPEEEFTVSTDDSSTAINMNIQFPHNIPSLDNLVQPSLDASISEIPPDNVSPLPNNSPIENPLVSTCHLADDRVNADINENYPEPSVIATDIVNNNDTCDNVNNSHSTQNSEYSVPADPTHDISTAEHSTYPVAMLLGTNENYIEQYSENNSEIDDADICDRSSPPPSYEEVTQENLVIAGHGVAYHGTI